MKLIDGDRVSAEMRNQAAKPDVSALKKEIYLAIADCADAWPTAQPTAQERHMWHDLRKDPDDLPPDEHKQYLAWDDFFKEWILWYGHGFRMKDTAREITIWRELPEDGSAE